jgi:hypothetical protein
MPHIKSFKLKFVFMVLRVCCTDLQAVEGDGAPMSSGHAPLWLRHYLTPARSWHEYYGEVLHWEQCLVDARSYGPAKITTKMMMSRRQALGWCHVMCPLSSFPVATSTSQTGTYASQQGSITISGRRTSLC